MWWVGRITGCDPPAVHRNRCSNGPDERTLQGYGRPMDRATAGLSDRTPTDSLSDRPGAWECSPLIRSSCCSWSSRSARRSARVRDRGCRSGPGRRPLRRARRVGDQSRPGRAARHHPAVRAGAVHLHHRTGIRPGVLRWPATGRCAGRDRRRLSCSAAIGLTVAVVSVRCSTSIRAHEPGSSPGRRRTPRRCRPPSSSSRPRSRPARSPTRSSATRSCTHSASWR